MHADAPFPDPGTCPFALRVFPACLRPWERGKRQEADEGGCFYRTGEQTRERGTVGWTIFYERWKIDFLIIARVTIKEDWWFIARESSEVRKNNSMSLFNDYSFGEKGKNFCLHHRFVSRYLNEFLTADSWQKSGHSSAIAIFSDSVKTALKGGRMKNCDMQRPDNGAPLNTGQKIKKGEKTQRLVSLVPRRGNEMGVYCASSQLDSHVGGRRVTCTVQYLCIRCWKPSASVLQSA